MIDAILDEALVAHLGIVAPDGQPLVIPTLHARVGDLVYLHGSVAGRTLLALGKGAPACLTVSLIDGLVLARSAMHHSANYRSVMLLGKAMPVEDPAAKRAAFRAIVEHVVPGRWPDVRPPSENELKATAVLAMRIDEASAKVRTGPPVDDEEDYAMPACGGGHPAVHAGRRSGGRSPPGGRNSRSRLRARIPPAGHSFAASGAWAVAPVVTFYGRGGLYARGGRWPRR